MKICVKMKIIFKNAVKNRKNQERRQKFEQDFAPGSAHV